MPWRVSEEVHIVPTSDFCNLSVLTFSSGVCYKHGWDSPACISLQRYENDPLCGTFIELHHSSDSPAYIISEVRVPAGIHTGYNMIEAGISLRFVTNCSIIYVFGFIDASNTFRLMCRDLDAADTQSMDPQLLISLTTWQVELYVTVAGESMPLRVAGLACCCR